MGFKAYFLTFIILINENVHQSQACPKECACSETQVDCYSRSLQSIPNNIPESVKNLDLHDNEIKDVNPESLSRLSNIENLFLKQNLLTDLKFLASVNLPKLKKLYIGNNEITIIDDNAFANLPSLQDLDLTKNNISEITEKLNISSLVRLTLSYNHLSSLQDDTLNGVRRLQDLILNNNNISFISKSAFLGMPNLSNLVIRGNPIKNIDHLFEDIGALSYLDASMCHLTHFPQGLPWALRYLKLSSNNLTIIESRDLYSTRHLAVIVLDNNQIEVIHDGALLYTPYLKELRISYNRLRMLPNIPKKIEVFTADNNNIQHILQYNFAHDSAMKVLSLSRNKIGGISPYTFSRLVNLTVLLLDHNEIKSLRNMTFANLRQLNIVDLEFNPIQKIQSRAFGGMQKLEQLKLGNSKSNKTIIEGVIFQDIPSLQNLDLQGSPSIINDIFNSSNLLRSLRNIQDFNLINGSLETLPMEVKVSLPNLKSLMLSDNPWRCDSAILVLRNWINDVPKLFGNAKLTCASPDHLMGRNIQNLSEEDFILAALSFTTSQLVEDIVSQTTMYDNGIYNTRETQIVDMTYQSEASSAVSPTEAMKTESNLEQSLPVEQDKSKSVEQDSMSEPILMTELYSKHSEQYLTRYTSTQLSDLTTVSSEAQIFPSTIIEAAPNMITTTTTTFEASNRLRTPATTEGTATASLRTLSPSTTTRKFSLTDSTSSTLTVNSRHPTQLPITSTTEVPSTTTIPPYTTSAIHPTITSQLIADVITKTPTLLPTSVISTAIPEITQPPSHSKKTSWASTRMTSSISSLPRIPNIFSTTQMYSKTHSWKNTPLVTATADNITASVESTSKDQTFLPVEPSLTSTLLHIATMELTTLPNSMLETSESETVRGLLGTALQSTEVQKSTLRVQDNLQSAFTIGPDTERKHPSYPATTSVKADNRLPALSSSPDAKLKVIIIVVSISLLALIIGLFVVIIVVRQCKKRKHLQLDEHAQGSQTETSDTVFIISHMAGEQNHNQNTETPKPDASSASSQDNPEAGSDCKKTKKRLKFSRQSSSGSAVNSKTSFNCMSEQTGDDSELLVYSWQ